MAIHRPRPDLGQFGFGEAAAGNRNVRCLVKSLSGAGGPQGPEECIGTRADERVEHEIRLRLDDGPDDLLMIRFAHREVALGHHRPAGRGEALTQDAVVLPRPYVIRADTIGAPAHMRKEILDQGNNVLIWSRTRVDDVIGALKPS